ncbi:MAG TPA: MOSC domain-containing protein [Actinomycetota bacterium]|nr:MOSC domain-containing protein [Actinomycetota bacterium]
MAGTVEAIFITPDAARPMMSIDEVKAISGEGLEGDRYFAKNGTWSKNDGPQRQVTLVEAEAVEAVARDYDIDVTGADTRRNIVTRGVALNHLVDRVFKVGDATFRGIRLCEPCKHLERVSGRAIRKPLVHRGGLNAEIVEDGMVRIGDSIEERDPIA